MLKVLNEEEPMIHSTIRALMSRKQRKDALNILQSMSERIKNLPGCIDCRVYLDVQKNCSLLFDQVWESAEDLNRHIRSDEDRNILLVMEMAAEKPEIRFETISNVTGMETIEKLRSGSEIHI